MNAHDLPDGRVVIDLCVYDTMFATELTGPFGSGYGRLERWTIDVVARTCSTVVPAEEESRWASVGVM